VKHCFDALHARRGGLRACEFGPPELAQFGRLHRLETYVGEVAGLDAVELPAHLASFDCRNNRLAWLGLHQDDFLAATVRLREQYGADRVAVIFGTSTSGMLQAEWAYHVRAGAGPLPGSFQLCQDPEQLLGAAFCRRSAGSERSFLRGFDRVLVERKGVCRRRPSDVRRCCRCCGGRRRRFVVPHHAVRLWIARIAVARAMSPVRADRSGISIGEGAGFALLEYADRAPQALARLAGWGESSDAHHMSSPHPEGLGAQLAMRGALERARLKPEQIGYINLHGTATRANDVAEGRAVAPCFGPEVPGSSTKAWFGHLLAPQASPSGGLAARAEPEFRTGNAQHREKDPACPNWLLTDNVGTQLDYVLSNSFGFGGSNCSLVFGRPS